MNKKIANKLKAYSAVAAALVTRSNVGASVVYTELAADWTSDTVKIQSLYMMEDRYGIDFNGDKKKDITIYRNGLIGANDVWASVVDFRCENDCGIAGSNVFEYQGYAWEYFYGEARVLETSYLVEGEFAHVVHIADYSSSVYDTYGKWGGVNHQYLGVKFLIGADVHYGWVELSVGTAASFLTVHSYAYETEPNTPIKINPPNPPAFISKTSSTTPTCLEDADGTATVDVTKGSEPYSYSWNTTSVQTTKTATGLVSGNYVVTVTDNAGSSEVTNVIIKEPNFVYHQFEGICEGTYLIFAGKEYREPGYFVDTIVTGWGCDYIFKLDLEVHNDTSISTYYIDEGEHINYYGNLIETEGIHYINITDITGKQSTCRTDSISGIEIIYNEVIPEEPLWAANVFNPNSSGELNQKFCVRGYNINEISITVFNRWGEKVF
ncbi:MAG: hypothetical protein HRT71_01495 [Flavobacteriales bacterium]|nr:hypothetical protein [Flavobacteriales bacterium]